MQQDLAPSIGRKPRLLGHYRRAVVLGVVSNFRSVNYLGRLYHYGSHYSDRGTLNNQGSRLSKIVSPKSLP
jgi:hypothetical protein